MSSLYIIVLSGLGLLASFAGFALPIILRSKKRERYKEVIEKKRKALFDQAREQAAGGRAKTT
jgi:tight adherence protein C